MSHSVSLPNRVLTRQRLPHMGKGTTDISVCVVVCSCSQSLPHMGEGASQIDMRYICSTLAVHFAVHFAYPPWVKAHFAVHGGVAGLPVFSWRPSAHTLCFGSQPTVMLLWFLMLHFYDFYAAASCGWLAHFIALFVADLQYNDGLQHAACSAVFIWPCRAVLWQYQLGGGCMPHPCCRLICVTSVISTCTHG
jgi:hypothetical protein